MSKRDDFINKPDLLDFLTKVFFLVNCKSFLTIWDNLKLLSLTERGD